MFALETRPVARLASHTRLGYDSQRRYFSVHDPHPCTPDPPKRGYPGTGDRAARLG